MELTNPIQEAERYLSNAREILSEKAEKEGDYYNDCKYVKMAGHTAWCGVLVALDSVLGIQEKKKHRQRLEFKDYQEAIGKADKKMPRFLLNAYDSLHKTLGYDGNLNYLVVQGALKDAQLIIHWAAKHYKAS